VVNPFILGIIASVVAVTMIVAELAGFRWFTLQLTAGCGLPLWTLFAVYAALQFVLWHGRRKSIELSDEEVQRWGDALERVTPTILSMYEDKVSVRDIAASLEASHGIPQAVTLRYIIALARHVRAHSLDARHGPPP
jgi:hypothetical protein